MDVEDPYELKKYAALLEAPPLLPRQLSSAGGVSFEPLTSAGSVQHSESTLQSTVPSLPDSVLTLTGERGYVEGPESMKYVDTSKPWFEREEDGEGAVGVS